MEERGRGELDRSEVVVDWARVPVSGLGRGSAALIGPLEGSRVASKGLGPLPRIKRGSLGRGWGREGSGALPLPRAAVISTGLRVRQRHGVVPCGAAVLLDVVGPEAELTRAARLARVRARARVRVTRAARLVVARPMVSAAEEYIAIASKAESVRYSPTPTLIPYSLPPPPPVLYTATV